ncbi:MAG: response regulator, partial [Deltaproteobacteria bacterium]
VIIGHCSLATLRPITSADNIRAIETAAERAAGLCQQMLAYAGKANISKSRINLGTLVDDMVKMSKSTISQNVKITSDLATDIPFVMVDASQIQQVTMNLIINASEAIGEAQGEVRVSLAKTAIIAEQRQKDYLGNIIPGGWYACLEVTDSGCGMDAETQNRIFEPFYTTKFTGRGLGMSAVLGIIKAHNGALQLFSQSGQGTTFKVYLPIQMTESIEGQFSQQPASLELWKGRGSVLLVEDEEQIVLIADAMLEELGFSVIKASNGKEALELYRKSAEEIRLVVTDIGMPVMDGYALFRELKQLDPALPIVISSGYGDTEVKSRIPIEDIAGLVSKPYNFEQLHQVLKRVVEGAQVECSQDRTFTYP